RARRRHGGDAVLPLMSRLASQVIKGPRREGHGHAVEGAGSAATKPQFRLRAEGEAEDMAEDRPVAVPADPGARIVAEQRCLHELVRIEAGELRRSCAQREEPIRYRVGRPDAGVVEIVAPAERGCEPFTGPLMETERR